MNIDLIPIERSQGCWSVGYEIQNKGNLLTTKYVTHITDGHQDAEFYANLFATAPYMLDLLKRLVSGLSNNGVPYDPELEDRVIEMIHIIKDLEEVKE